MLTVILIRKAKQAVRMQTLIPSRNIKWKLTTQLLFGQCVLLTLSNISISKILTCIQLRRILVQIIQQILIHFNKY